MRAISGGVVHVASFIEEDIHDRETGLYKPHIEALSDLAASALTCRSANTAEWQSVLPRKSCDEKSQERYISRCLSNPKVVIPEVMSGFVPEIFEQAGSDGRTVILAIDQSQITTDYQCLMVSLQTGERAIPILWLVEETKGNIGFPQQKELLDSIAKMLPEDVKILLAGDRFYGTSALVNWCEEHGWQYRIHLKGNNIFQHDGGEITGNDAAKMKITSLESATFNETKITTNIGILHEKGHPEPWIIALDCRPNKYKVLDYGMRWGIECMFSDFKSRGFGITKTQLIHGDRIERLILVLTIALYWAVSTGMKPLKKPPRYTKKNCRVVSHSPQ